MSMSTSTAQYCDKHTHDHNDRMYYSVEHKELWVIPRLIQGQRE